MSNISFKELLQKIFFSKEEILRLLESQGDDRQLLFAKAAETKKEFVGNIVYFRGLIEYSNRCSKNCYYCGIRRENPFPHRYTMTDNEVYDAVKYAYKERYSSLVIQSGEINSQKYINQITKMLKEIREITNKEMGITLSLGEQSEETLQQWKDAGARRYLLRIETSSPELYSKLHPNDKLHDYEGRLNVLRLTRQLGYQVGSGVMIGLPFQTIENLADDLIFLRDFDIDMVGMGPYIEHSETPLFQYRDSLLPQTERFDLTLKMIAILRIMMKDINIASTTAMQAIDKMGREKALKAGANVIMPNLTPQKYRKNYMLYEDKPCIDEEADQCKNCLSIRVRLAGDTIGFGEWGDSKHFANRK
ncbi:MAG: [FeFe] hydrogenase H-cluster radical SAM maturase HydE [Bacteroidales bacterium]|jgi:biotin synthase|nr:[FeFe] hydrogenase H-cluster radical SAM maturase HydE [Bacteroidales bacterium]